MKKEFKHKFLKSAWVLILGMGLQSCGNNRGSMRIVSNGVQSEVSVQGTYCEGSVYAQGNMDGAANTPVYCTVSFRTQYGITDVLRLSVFDAGAIRFQNMDRPLTLGTGLIDMSMTYQAQPLFITSGTMIFHEMNNVVGGEVCAEYELHTAITVYNSTIVRGNFCARISNGVGF